MGQTRLVQVLLCWWVAVQLECERHVTPSWGMWHRHAAHRLCWLQLAAVARLRCGSSRHLGGLDGRRGGLLRSSGVWNRSAAAEQERHARQHGGRTSMHIAPPPWLHVPATAVAHSAVRQLAACACELGRPVSRRRPGGSSGRWTSIGIGDQLARSSGNRLSLFAIDCWC